MRFTIHSRNQIKSSQIKSNVGFRGEERTNKLSPHMTPSPEIEPEPHWWEAIALTTAPTLLPSKTHIRDLMSDDFIKKNFQKVKARYIVVLVGTLRNHDADGNENVSKQKA